MRQTEMMWRVVGPAVLAVSLAAVPSTAARAADTDSAEALLYSTMPSTAAHRPEMAMDGNDKTYYKTVYGMDDGDTFLVLLSHAIPVKSVRVATGDDDGMDKLTNAVVETSADGATFAKAAAFNADGVAEGSLDSKPVTALRIRLNARRGVPSLVVREIAIDSPAKITHVQTGPGRPFSDISRAPELAEWAHRAEREMEDFWPDTAALLYSDGFITPNMVNVVYRTGPGVTDVAATGGGVMTVNTAWCKAHPEDTGLTVHEVAHVIQSMSAYNPVWLIEGIADYIRWIKFEPQNYKVRINPQTATYHDSYRTTGTFLAWCELHYDSRLVTKLNNDIRFGKYTNDKFKQYCGKDVDALWTEFVAALKVDQQGVIAAPVPAGDRPRKLPTVQAGTSAPVDLTAAFTAVGVSSDGVAAKDTGADGEGNSYPATEVGAGKTVKDVAFKFGPAGAKNVVACQGQTVALPAGAYGSLWLLGTGVEGNQLAQPFVVTYDDGTKETLTQSFSDWYAPRNFPGESRAIQTTYRNLPDGQKDPRPFFIYSYGFTLNSGKQVKTLTLPNNPYVKILAASLAK